MLPQSVAASAILKIDNETPKSEEQEDPFIVVGSKRKGESFGEYALISNRPRLATIRCVRDTFFAVLDKLSYQRVFARLEEIALNEKIDFLKAIPCFSHWARHALAKLTFYLLERKYIRHHAVFKEGQPSEYVYMVLEGEFEV